jgi:hypothetical protein
MAPDFEVDEHNPTPSIPSGIMVSYVLNKSDIWFDFRLGREAPATTQA